jgi:hypothetical protein
VVARWAKDFEGRIQIVAVGIPVAVVVQSIAAFWSGDLAVILAPVSIWRAQITVAIVMVCVTLPVAHTGGAAFVDVSVGLSEGLVVFTIQNRVGATLGLASAIDHTVTVVVQVVAFLDCGGNRLDDDNPFTVDAPAQSVLALSHIGLAQHLLDAIRRALAQRPMTLIDLVGCSVTIVVQRVAEIPGFEQLVATRAAAGVVVAVPVLRAQVTIEVERNLGRTFNRRAGYTGSTSRTAALVLVAVSVGWTRVAPAAALHRRTQQLVRVVLVVGGTTIPPDALAAHLDAFLLGTCTDTFHLGA